MKKIILGVLAGLVLGAAAAWTLLKHHEGGDKEAKTEEHAGESHVVHTNGQTFVKLDTEAQGKAGLKLAPLEAATLKPEFKGFGRVLDPAMLATVVAENATARIALDASTRELQRLKVLAQDQNASARALEVAAAAVQRDQVTVDAAQLKLVTGWGKAIASQKDLPAFLAALAAQEAALVRIDLPLGDALKNPPTGARLAALTAEDQPMDAEFLGPAVNADAQTQGQGFLFLVRNKLLPPDTAMVGWLTVSGDIENGVMLPRSAVVRHEGEAFAYVQSGDGLFERKEIELEHPTAKGWFVVEGLKPGQTIVLTGAQQLLSEELKGAGGEE